MIKELAIEVKILFKNIWWTWNGDKRQALLMLVDISSICNGNNSVTIRAFAIENRGKPPFSTHKSSRAAIACNAGRIERINRRITKGGRSNNRGPDESATRSYKSITKLSVHSIRSAPPYNSRIYIVEVLIFHFDKRESLSPVLTHSGPASK